MRRGAGGEDADEWNGIDGDFKDDLALSRRRRREAAGGEGGEKSLNVLGEGGADSCVVGGGVDERAFKSEDVFESRNG